MTAHASKATSSAAPANQSKKGPTPWLRGGNPVEKSNPSSTNVDREPRQSKKGPTPWLRGGNPVEKSNPSSANVDKEPRSPAERLAELNLDAIERLGAPRRGLAGSPLSELREQVAAFRVRVAELGARSDQGAADAAGHVEGIGDEPAWLPDDWTRAHTVAWLVLAVLTVGAAAALVALWVLA